jgi:predicted RNA-binding protein with PIN domain
VAAPRVIVDGYNLIHKMPALAALVGSDLEQARQHLVAQLAGYRSTHNVRVTVVFDGRGLSQPRGRGPAGVEVVFSRAPQTADDVIKRMLTAERSPRACTVVTSDNSIALHVRDYGARVISSADFAGQMAGMGAGRRSDAKPARAEKPEMTRAAVAEWEEYFRRGRGDRDGMRH